MQTFDALDIDGSFKNNPVMLAFAKACQDRCCEFASSESQNLGHLEEALLKPSHEVLADALQKAAQAKADGAPPHCPKCGRKLIRRQKVNLTVQTRFGPITLRRVQGFCSHCKEWFCPADAVLGLEGGRSPFVQEAHALTAVQMPVHQASRVVERLTGLKTPPATLDRSAKKTGRKAQTLRRQLDKQTREGKGPQAAAGIEEQTLVIQIDAFNIRERGEDWGRAQELRDRGEEPAHWHWVYVATVFVLEDRLDKNGRALIAQRGFVVTRQGIDELREQLHAEAMRRGLGRARRVLVIADGAVWIWNLVQQRFPEATQRLDLFHAGQHLWAAAEALHGPGQEARQWVEPLLDQLQEGRPQRVIQKLEEALAGLKETQAAHLQKEIAYFKNHEHRMDYGQARQLGEPCGSGPVESTCRQYQCRFKRTGQFWTKEGDEALLTVESFWRNDRWPLLFPHSNFDPSKN
jgi:hypothetical protein